MRGVPGAQVRNRVPWGAYTAEVAGTFFMVAWGLSAVVVTMSPASPVPALMPDYRIRLLATGILFASGGTLVIYSPLGQRSGGHLNPAVSLTFRMLGQIGTRDMILYSAAQALGAVGGAGLVKLLWGAWATDVGVGVTKPAPGISPAEAAAVELLITWSLLWVILFFVGRPKLHRWTGLAAGAWVAFLVFTEAPVTGTSLNPARSLGPAVVADDYRDLWVYFAGPLGGAVLAALLWKPVLARGWRHLPCAKIYHTDRHPCHFPACRFGRRLEAGAKGSRKEEAP